MPPESNASTATPEPAPSDSHRRVESDSLVELVRDASDDATRRVGFYVADACTSELLKLCAGELELVKSAYAFSNGNTNSPVMASMQRRVHMCLASNKQELGPKCWEVFVAQVIKNHHEQTNPTAMPTPEPTGYNASYLADRGRRKDSGNLRRQWEGDLTQAVTTSYSSPAGGTIQVFINNNGGLDRLDSERTGCHEHGPPLLMWLIILPFFCVGVVVCVKHVVKLLSKRGTSLEYSPLQAADTTS